MALTVIPSEAVAQSINFQTQATEIVAGMPFQLSIVLTDFEEEPRPEISPFTMANAEVTFLGLSPRISSMTTNINGKVTSKREVTYVYTYNILPKVPGNYELPQIKVNQNGKEVVSEKRVSFTATSVPTTGDMKLELELPQRALWVGESFVATLHWYVNKDFSTQSFTVPMLEMGEFFDISEPTAEDGERTLALNVGGRQIAFPFKRSNVRVGGKSYTRFSIRMNITPVKTGTIDVPAASVFAQLEDGIGRDGWGFPTAQYKLYQATDVAKTLTIKDLPSAQRPESFANALGENYDIAVTADRTIVKMGDPIILTIEISSDAVMDGLILPNLSRCGLDEALFGVADEEPIPEVINEADGRKIWRFKVPVRIKSDRVREVPPIAFSYFDPISEKFSTARSQPIALHVTPADKVGMNDVVMNSTTAGSAAAAVAKKQDGADNEKEAINLTANSGLSLGLETKPEMLTRSLGNSSLRSIEIAAYASPFVLWVVVGAVRRSKRRSDRYKPQRDAARALRDAFATASKVSASEAAANISNAMTAFVNATETDKKPFMSKLEAIDAEAYRPDAQNAPLKPELVQALRGAVKSNVNPKYAKIVSGILSICLAFGLTFGAVSDGFAQSVEAPVAAAQEAAPSTDADRLAQADSIYHEAMSMTDRKQRMAKFAYAASIFRDLSERYPQNASLCLDWGNAAFNAVDFGSASLAWRRALSIDSTLDKAKANIAYIDALQGVSSNNEKRALESFFFLNERVSASMRLFIASLCFFVMMMLCIPWRESLKRPLRSVAILPMLVWLWLLASVFMQASHTNDAVVMNETTLRNADNAGASSVYTAAPGMLVTIVETRGDWTLVKLPNNISAWLTTTSIERVEK